MLLRVHPNSDIAGKELAIRCSHAPQRACGTAPNIVINVTAPARFKHWQGLCHIHTTIGYRLMAKGKEKEFHASCRKLVAILDKLEPFIASLDDQGEDLQPPKPMPKGQPLGFFTRSKRSGRTNRCIRRGASREPT